MPTEPAYIKISERKQRDRSQLLPSQWRVPNHLLATDPPSLSLGPQNVLSVPSKLLSPKELAITETYSVPDILSAIARQDLSSSEVTSAFIHRATIAQDLTNCITEVLFERATKRAKELDDYLATHKTTIGPLHGLVVSVKDTFYIKGYDSSIGLASLCYKPATTNAPLIDALESLGCIIIAKTNIPQTLASLDSVNNVWGRTMNPTNRNCTAGGSSGGEGVMVAMKACMVGVGTDIGGSIRVPAYVNGVVGFKPSEGRWPYGGQQGTGIEGGSALGVQAVAGPIARTVSDAWLVFREVCKVSALFADDVIPTPLSWNHINLSGPKAGSGNNGQFVVGVLRSDGNSALLPPIDKIMTETASLLRNAGVQVIEIATPPAWKTSQSAMSKIMGVGGNNRLDSMIKATGEPLVPWMTTRFRAGPPQNYERMAELQVQRQKLQKDMIDSVWTTTDSFGRRRKKLDAIICPLAAHPVPPIEGYNAVGYTSSWVYLDCPSGSVPIRDFAEADMELGKPMEGKASSSWDEKSRELWDEKVTDRRVYLGTKLSVQVVVPRLEDEKLAVAMDVVAKAADGSSGVGRAKL
jgi:Asp-tRNA(Asn)/Glu-tRNA(Gln) amidotransferase A subunit family amidase